jgi:uncharacterized membrane protein
MSGLVPWLLFLHVLAAIAGLGPTFAFPIIGGMGGREPRFGNFATRVSFRVSERLVEPLVLTMPVTGVLMIWAAEINPFVKGSRWLLLAIILYVIDLSIALFVQRAAVKRVIALTGGESGPPPDAPPPAGPPPGLPAAVAAVQRNGMILTVILLAIIFLMVVKPNLGF